MEKTCSLGMKQFQSKVIQQITNINKSLKYLLKYPFTPIKSNTYTNQNGRSLEIENKVNLTLLINKQKCVILWNQEQEKILKDMDVYHLLEIFLTNIKSKFGYRTTCFKTCFQKVVHKTGNCSGKKLQNVVTNQHRIC